MKKLKLLAAVVYMTMVVFTAKSQCPQNVCTSELVFNGNFSLGNVGFFSALPANCACGVGSYCVGNEPLAKCAAGGWQDNLWDCTVGNPAGSFMIIDGNNTNPIIWQQNVNVVSGRTYCFSMCVLPSVSLFSAGQNLNVTLNGTPVIFSPSGSYAGTYVWTTVTVSFTSTVTGSVPLTITQQGQIANGDYGLDNVSLIESLSPNLTIPNLTPCANAAPFIMHSILMPANVASLTYSGNTSGINPATHQFNPATASIGPNTFTACYNMIGGGQCCLQYTITVLSLPIITTTLPTTMCTTDPIVKLGKKQTSTNTIVNPYGYFWTDGVSGSLNSPSPGVSFPASPPGFVKFNPALANLGANPITYTATGSNGCTNSLTGIIYVCPPPTLNIQALNLCTNSTTISANAAILPAGCPISYSWTGPGIVGSTTGPSINTNAYGTYTVTASTDANCSTTQSVTLLPPPTVTTNLPTVMCINDPIVKLGKKVTATNTQVNAYGYFWSSGGTGVINSPSPGVSFPAFPPGFVNFNPALANIGANPITFTATATNGCSASVTGIIYVCPPPTLNLQAINPCTNITTINANATMLPFGCPITYSWTGPGIVGSTTGSSINTNAYGTYTVTASTDPNCVTTQSFTLTPPPSIGITSSDPTPCVGDVVTLTTNSFGPLASYSWTPGGQTTAAINVTTSGTYCVTGTAANGCASVACINVNFSSPPPVNIIGDNTICQGANVQLTASIIGNCLSPSIQWLANGVPIAGATSPVLSIPSNTFAAGTVISVTLCCNGCCATTIAATIIGLPTVTLDPVADIDLCFWDGNPIQLNGTSNGTNCFYSGAGVNAVSGLFDPIAAGGIGIYNVSYTCELNGCTNTASQNINVIETNFWHQTTKNTNFRDIGNDIITDANGNVYITGLYIRQTTFEGGGNSDVTLVSGVGIPNFSFVAKYDACGSLMWVAYAVSGASGQPNLGNSITLDENGGYVYAAGNFTNEIRYKYGQGDFGTVPNFASAIAPGNNGYVIRLQMGNGTIDYISPVDLDDNTYSTAITANETTGKIYLGGHHSGALNPGQDFMYVHKYSPSGAGIGIPDWQINGMGDGSHYVNDMDFNETDGSLWFIGDYKIELLLDATLIVNGTTNSRDAYVARYFDGVTPLQSLFKKGNMTGAGEMNGNGISVNNSNGNAFITGNYFVNSVTNVFEIPGQSLSNAAALNGYFMALNTSGTNVWSQPSFAEAGTNHVRGKSASYRNGRAYFAGTYNNNSTFTGNSLPSALSYNTVGASTGQWHTYAAAFDATNGSTNWLNATTDPVTNTAFHEGNAIATDNFGHAFITGSYLGTMGYQAGVPASGNLVSTLAGVNAFTLRVDLNNNGEFRNEVAEETSIITNVSNGIKVFPNPAHTQISLEIENWLAEEKYEVSLTGIDGKSIMKKSVTSQLSVIDLAGLSAGIYFVTVQNGTSFTTVKLIKLD